jgi:predicted GIY-YIG superfamily endonuclease
MSFYTYLLRCNDASYYAGHTDDLEARLVLHNSGVVRGYTQARRPLQLVWFATFPTRDEAFQAERQIKGWSRAKKEALIARDWGRIQALAAVRSPDRQTDPAHPTSASG